MVSSCRLRSLLLVGEAYVFGVGDGVDFGEFVVLGDVDRVAEYLVVVEVGGGLERFEVIVLVVHFL